MVEFVKSESFTFIVNGDHFEGSVAEAVLVSLAVSDLSRQDSSVHSFCFSDSTLNSHDFSWILKTVCSHLCDISKDHELSLLSIFRDLGNESLALLLLASMNLLPSASQSSSNSNSMLLPTSASQ
jgi:hypothetical protein